MCKILKSMSVMLLLFAILFSCLSCGETVSIKEEDWDLSVLMPSLGKADSFLIQTKESNVVIDTGYEETALSLVRLYKNEGVETIDALILTHFDSDHVGGVKTFLLNFEIGHVYMPANLTGSVAGQTVLGLLNQYSASYTIIEEDVLLTLSDTCTLNINGTKLTEIETENDESLICSLKCNIFSMLFLGDALKDRIDEYKKLDSDLYYVVKLPHHGDYFKKLEEYLARLTPRDLIITVDESEREVEQDLIDMCNDYQYNLRRTDEGTIRLVYIDASRTYKFEQG